MTIFNKLFICTSYGHLLSNLKTCANNAKNLPIKDELGGFVGDNLNIWRVSLSITLRCLFIFLLTQFQNVKLYSQSISNSTPIAESESKKLEEKSKDLTLATESNDKTTSTSNQLNNTSSSNQPKDSKDTKNTPSKMLNLFTWYYYR